MITFRVRSRAAAVILVTLMLFLHSSPAAAQDNGQIQKVSGSVEAGRGFVYSLPTVRRGDIVTVYVSGTSGNLDPFIALSDSLLDPERLVADYAAVRAAAVDAGEDPLAAATAFADDVFVVWDDDSGSRYDATFSYEIPADGDYRLLVTSTLARTTSGQFEALIGINAPEVSNGRAQPNADDIALVDVAATRPREGVRAVRGMLGPDKTSTFFVLNTIRAGDTFYAAVTPTDGDLRPTLILEDFSGKPLVGKNYGGTQTTAVLEHTFTEDGSDYRIRVTACCGDAPTAGDFRLVAGIDAPQVLEGQDTEYGREALREPIQVAVGMALDQITGVDQKAENYGAVANLRFDWTDPTLAYDPTACQCAFQTFTLSAFTKYLDDRGLNWPEFSLFNQQGNRWIQNQLIVLWPDGRATYFERFTTNFQAPDFDFRLFPFDTQTFYMRVDALFPEEYYVYVDGDSSLGEQLGEEEWIITSQTTEISNQQFGSRFSYRFDARRHLNFYISRIFIPVAIILLVSWFTFFLQDFGKRVDVAAGNLLLFIAFNFTISADLPRLGYLTLMDSILISAFIVTSLVVIVNVYFKRLEQKGKSEQVHRIDRYLVWLYPIAYIVAFLAVTLLFT